MDVTIDTMSTQTSQSHTPFVLTTVGTFLVLAATLVAIDFVPEPRVAADSTSVEIVAVATNTPEEPEPTPVMPTAIVPRDTTPVRITIEAIDLDTPIITPASTDIDVLDRALLAGAVRYPNSAYAGERGNMLIFGHSSYLPVVHNKAFQAFNELDDVEPGDTILVYSITHVYAYEVLHVRLTRAEEEVISFEASEPLLTLATCNTFGAKQERWVAQARFISMESLNSESNT